MGNVKQYKALVAAGTDELNRQIALLIQQGWQPLGGLTITHVQVPAPNNQTMHSIQCGQAMTKE